MRVAALDGLLVVVHNTCVAALDGRRGREWSVGRGVARREPLAAAGQYGRRAGGRRRGDGVRALVEEMWAAGWRLHVGGTRAVGARRSGGGAGSGGVGSAGGGGDGSRGGDGTGGGGAA